MFSRQVSLFVRSLRLAFALVVFGGLSFAAWHVRANESSASAWFARTTAPPKRRAPVPVVAPMLMAVGNVTGSTGSTTAIANRQPALAMRWLIATSAGVNGNSVVLPSTSNSAGGGSGTTDQTPYLGELRLLAFDTSSSNVPAGWAECNGQTLTISQNLALYSLLGTAYGGNGTTTFALPDMRGRVPVGTGQGTGLTNVTRSQFGAEAATLPAHTHTITGGTTASTGSGAALINKQPSVGLLIGIVAAGADASVGTVRLFAGYYYPPGFVACDGRSLSTSTYSALFAKIGYTYGGSGANFNVPDLRGRTPIGKGQGTGLTNRTLGQQVGTEIAAVSANDMPAHTHTWPGGTTGSIGNASQNSYSTMQPSLVLRPALTLYGTFNSFGSTNSPSAGYAEVRFFANSSALPTNGGNELWVECDGSVHAIEEFNGNYDFYNYSFIVTNLYGGDGENTVGVPDLRGRAVVNRGASTGLTTRNMGDKFGAESAAALTVANLPAHTHDLPTPTVTTPTNANVTSDAATLGGNVTADGFTTITERGIVYSSTNTNPQIGGANVTKVASTGTTGVFTINVSGLNASTTHYFAAYATNTNGTGYSTVGNFMTTAPPTAAPTITTPTSANVMTTTATLGGNVTSDGGSAMTGRGVVFSATNSDPVIGGSGVTQVSTTGTTGIFTVNVSLLTAGTTYKFKAYAANGIGTSYTGVGMFTTPTPLGGTKTVCASGCDYANLTGASGAFAAINAAGLAANLTLSISSNLTEDGTNGLNQWTETGGGNYTLTLQPADAATKLISGTVADSMIRLNGADRVTIDGRFGGTGRFLTFRNTNTSHATIALLNDASTNTIRNCVIEGATTDASNGVVFFSTGATTGNDDNTITENQLRDRSDAAGVPANLFYSQGTSGVIANTSNTLSNNELFNFTGSGIKLAATGNEAWAITGNTIYEATARTTALTGIACNSGGTNTITRNIIRDLQTSGAVVGMSFGSSSGAVVRFVNNQITLLPSLTNDQTMIGVQDNGASGSTFNAYFNSVLLGGTASGASSTWAMLRTTTAASTHTARNNIYFNNRTGGTGHHFAAGNESTAGMFSSNYNLFVGTGATATSFLDLGNSLTMPVSFAAWQAGSGNDANSSAGNPGGNFTAAMFVNPTLGDLHIVTTGNALVSNAGVPISGLTTDYDNDTRNALMPDLGSDEFAAPTKVEIVSHDPNPSLVNETVLVKYTVTPTAGAGTPSGSVTVGDGVNSCTATVADGQCSLALATAGGRMLTVSYGGNAEFQSSSANTSHTVSSCPTITLSPTTLADGTVGAGYGNNLSALGGAPGYSFQVISGNMPTGLTLNSNGTWSGTATMANTFGFTVKVTDNNGCPGTQVYSLKINAATPVVTWSNPAAISSGTALSATQLNATANVPGMFAYTPAVGTVLGAGSGQMLSVLFTPTDTTNYAAVTKSVTINVLNSCGTTANPATLPSMTFGMSFVQTLTASPTGSYTFSLLSGTLPPGISLVNTLGIYSLRGTPTARGIYTFTIKATKNGTTCETPRTYIVTIP